VRQAGYAQWWILLTVTLFIVFAWPPAGDKSLALKFTNWIVDPAGRLPILPGSFPAGMGDDVDSVEAHDSQVRMYYELYHRGGWTQRRLQLKVADDPTDPATERQVLLGIGALTGFLVWRFGGGPSRRREER
jgi:hypothetical protein